MMLDQIRNLTYQMRLFGIHEACERRAQRSVIKRPSEKSIWVFSAAL